MTVTETPAREADRIAAVRRERAVDRRSELDLLGRMERRCGLALEARA
jgi:hypothetical protein